MACLDVPRVPRRATLAVGRESWSLVASVDDFSACDPADYFRIFPRLLPRTRTVPVALRAHITRCLAVLAWRAYTEGDGAPMAALCAGTSVDPAEMVELGAREHDTWFPIEGVAADPGVVDERRAFALVDALRREMNGSALRSFDHATAALFSFTTGVHAAYLWPEAVLSHEFFTAAGWLGHVWRVGTADMPSDLAEYFDDVLERDGDGSWVVRDKALDELMPGSQIKGEVGRAAHLRRGGTAASLAWAKAAPGPEGRSW